MALPLTETDKFLLLSAVGAPETRDRISALLDLAGTGNMTGPASATDNALVRFDGTTGALVQNSGVIVSDANAITGVASLNGVSAATIAFLDATSSIQTQINTKAPSASPTLTGTVTISGVLNATGSTGHSIVGNQTNALIVKSLSGNSNGLRLYSNTATDVASVVNGYNAALELGTNNTVYQTISNGGLVTIGASGGTQVHQVNGGLSITGSVGWTRANSSTYGTGYHDIAGTVRFPASLIQGQSGSGYPYVGFNARSTSTTAQYQYDQNDYASVLQFGTGAASGFYFRQGPSGTAGNTITLTDVMTINNSGLITLGASGGTSTHVVNGSLTLTNSIVIENENNALGSITLGQVDGGGARILTGRSNGNIQMFASSDATGSYYRIYGPSHPTFAQDIQINNGVDNIFYYDHSSNSLVYGVNSSTGQFVWGTNLQLGFSGSASSAYLISKGGGGAGTMELTADTGANTGGNIKLWGATHATQAGDVALRDGSTNILFYDKSANELALGTSGTSIRLNSTTTATGAAVATLTNAPAGASGDPDIWLNINVNGTVYVIPAWTP